MLPFLTPFPPQSRALAPKETGSLPAAGISASAARSFDNREKHLDSPPRLS